jgi:hypothetical protein
MMIGTDLQIPGVSNKGKLEQVMKHVRRKNLQGGHCLGMARELDTQPVLAQATQSVTQILDPSGRVFQKKRGQG